jgi:thiosulfate/3-mercaptopyruvate sulfurtransferase
MGFWLMKLYGHADVRILNCSRQTWQHQGRAWTTDATSPTSATYRLLAQDRQIRADASRVRDAIDDPTRTIVDVRSAAEFRGERFWPSGGLEEGGLPVTCHQHCMLRSARCTTTTDSSATQPTASSSHRSTW